MFCPNCGNKCLDNDIFCGECGTRLPVTKSTESAPSATPKPAESPKPATQTQTQTPERKPDKPTATPKPEPKPAPAQEPAQPQTPAEGIAAPVANSRPRVTLSEDERSEGVILTHSTALAAKLKTSAEVILRLLAAYAEASLVRGIRYRVVDAADYMLLNPSAAGRRVSVSPRDGWVEYNNILTDHYRYGRTNKGDETCYLFIVGGEDIVPMPVMRHYMASHPQLKDKDIDTDIPYAYMLGDKTYEMLDSGKIYEYEQYFHVGRLPFPADASLQDLAAYLKRASAASEGIELDSYYGQSNMPWGKESQVVCTPLRHAGLHASSKRYEGGSVEIQGRKFPIVQGGLFYSPPVTEDNIEMVFDPNATFYYFNLHGSNRPTDRGYYADYVGGAVMPEHVATMARPNIFVTEACYGAKFQQYRRNESILLSAITSETILFLGSSRIAFCNNRYSIDNSDRLANVFIAELLNGKAAGDALYEARKSFFEYDNGRLYDQQLTSIAEFNLFGDPSLKVHSTDRPVKRANGRKTLAEGGVKCVTESKCLYDAKGTEERPKSLLDEVRSAVDRNLMEIRKTIDKQLYEQLGVEPRSLSHIFQKRFPDGKEFYSFDYAEKKDDVERLHCAIADKNGNITTIISTK